LHDAGELLPVEDQLLVDVVGDHYQVVLDGLLGNFFQVGVREHHSGGIAGAVENDDPGALVDGF
jgi:hypothetical protein